jgi:hypothetical protein
MSYGTVQAEKMTTESGYSLGAGNASSFKNKIINGAMLIAQRTTSAVTTSGSYPVDRFVVASNANDFTSIQNTTVPSGSNFLYSVSIQPTSTKTPGAGTYATISQGVEGFNMQGLGWGTASAQPITVSFWVRSSKTGIYSVSTKNADASRAWCQEYTINAANTWEFKSYTITGCPDGSWPINNTRGMTFDFWLSGQNTQTSTIGSWISGNANMSTNQVNFFDNTSNVFYITGLQVEVGTVATSFDYRSYGTELFLCQRYYEPFGNGWWCSGETTNYNVVYGGSFLVPKRTAPTCSLLYTDLVLYQFGVANRNGSGCSIISSSQMFTWGGQIKVAGWSTITTGQLYGGGGSVAAGFSVQPMAASAEL